MTSRLSEGDWKSRTVLLSPIVKCYYVLQMSRRADFKPGDLGQQLMLMK